MSADIACGMVCEEAKLAEKLGAVSESPRFMAPSQTSRETTTTADNTAFESEDPQENLRLLSPPGLKGSRPWDDWDEEAPDSPLKEGMLGETNSVLVPPGLGGLETGMQSGVQFEMPAGSPWCPTMPEHLGMYSMVGSLGDTDAQKTSLQVTSFPCDEWKALFPPNFAGHDLSDKWESQEPAVILPSDIATADTMMTSEDDPAYVKSDNEMSAADLLAAENARLTMENEILKAKYMESLAFQSGDLSPSGYWPGDGNMHGMDMSWGVSPFSGNAWYPMMHMGYTGMSFSKKSSTRARTDSDIGHEEHRNKGGNARARTMTDPEALGSVCEAFNTGEYTTVMLRNLPNNYSRAMLLKLIDAEGFGNQYDFIYLPMDFKSHASLGYAFVNLVTAELAQRFFETFEGFHRWVVPSQKVCSVNWSHPYQGLDAHIERYRNSPVMHEDVPDEYKPMVFKNGERFAFPPPTKKLKVPRMRPGHDKAAIEESGSA